MDTGFAVDPLDVRRFFEEKAHSVISMLEREYKPLRIWQWGSLLDRKRFSEISDIDIAVEGIRDAVAFFELFGKAMALTTLPLDLLELERVEPMHAASIRKHGRLVYERS